MCLLLAFPLMLSDISIPNFIENGKNMHKIMLSPQNRWPLLMNLTAVMRSVAMSIVGKAAFRVKWVSIVCVAFVLLLCTILFIAFLATLIRKHLSPEPLPGSPPLPCRHRCQPQREQTIFDHPDGINH